MVFADRAKATASEHALSDSETAEVVDNFMELMNLDHPAHQLNGRLQYNFDSAWSDRVAASLMFERGKLLVQNLWVVAQLGRWNSDANILQVLQVDISIWFGQRRCPRSKLRT